MGCIYVYTNTVNNKQYIGQSIHDATKCKKKEHLSPNSNCTALARAIKKYGQAVFTFDILEDGILPDFLDDFERQYIANRNTIAPNGYNLTIGGASGGRITDNARKALSDACKGRVPWNKGKRGIYSPETLRQMSVSRKGRVPPNKGKPSPLKGRPRQPFTEEHKANISRSLKGKHSYTPSATTRRNISKANSGANHYFYGQHHSEDTKRKMSESHKIRVRTPH